MSFSQLEKKRRKKKVPAPNKWRPNLPAFHLSPEAGEGSGEWGRFMTANGAHVMLLSVDVAQGGWSGWFGLGQGRT